MTEFIQKIRLIREDKRIWNAKMSEPMKATLVYRASSEKAKGIRSNMSKDDLQAILGPGKIVIQ